MTLHLSKPDLSRLIFLALVLVFNWPLLSIPTGQHLLFWLFAAWALAIAVLFAVARRTAGAAAAPMPGDPAAAPGQPEPAGLVQAAEPGAGGAPGESGPAGPEHRHV